MLQFPQKSGLDHVNMTVSCGIIDDPIKMDAKFTNRFAELMI